MAGAGLVERDVQPLTHGLSNPNSTIDDDVHGAGARFVSEDASLDVLGVRARRVPATLVQAVLRRYPRLDFDAAPAARDWSTADS